MQLISGAFKHNEQIPARYTCDGENINPPLLISDIPKRAESLALIMDDPDATGGRTFDHWLMWNIAPDTAEIKENSAPEGAIQGLTGFGKSGYGGSCPPRGNLAHRYVFKLYALDKKLELPAGSPKAELEKAMEGRILSQAVLIGKYGR